MLALTHDQLAEHYAPGLGRLIGPRLRSHPERTAAAGWPWAADNDAYSDWNEPRFLRMLDAIAGIPGCKFVTAPDIVGDHPATLERFWRWRVEIAFRGLPVAFVAQDGVTTDTLPWDDCDGVFIGGTDQFKLGPAAEHICREARRRGHWLHMGRVNSHRRMRYAHQLGCHSIDGTNYARWNGTHLATGQRHLTATLNQTHLSL